MERAAENALRPNKDHKGWNSRGYLPHFDCPEKVQSITFHLGDSVPAHVVQTWRQELMLASNMPASDPAMMELLHRFEKYADAGHGNCWLRDERVAALVEESLLRFDAERYHLLAWCVMPNHVHVLVECLDGFLLGAVVHSWKSYTATVANKLLGRCGPFWMADYFDRYIRDERHLKTATDYIEQNPVSAGLVRDASHWLFSSARRRESRRHV